MYTILVNEANELITSVKERIMQRSKLVDSLHFLVDPIYKEVDMSNFSCTMEYVLPISREYKTESLIKSETLYKGKLQYKLPFDTCLTKEHGKIEVKLTFTMVELNPDGKAIQRVRKTSSTTITIVPISAWSDVVADDALTALDQRLLQIDAMLGAVHDMNMYLDDTKADSLIYDDKEETLQLSANGVGIGDKIPVRDMLEDGIPVVNFAAGTGTDDDKEDEDDSVVEFGDIVAPEKPDDNDDDIVEF